MSKAAELAALIGSQSALSNRNLIINGAMNVAQRGTSHTYSNGESGYDSIDRIYSAAFVTGGSLAISQQTANYSGVDAKYFLRATPSGSVSAGSATIYSEYRVEDVISMSNKTFTLSFDAKAATALTFQFRRRQNYGSGGSSEEYSSFTDIPVTTSWQRKTITFTIPDLSGKTIGSGSFFSLFFYWSTGQGSGNLNDAAIDITNLQLEVGEQATPFEHRSYGDELAACQRYFETIRFIAGTVYAAVTNQFGSGGQIVQAYKVTKRTTPTVSIDDTSWYKYNVYNGSNGAVTISAYAANQDYGGISYGGLGNNSVHWFYGNSGTTTHSADAEL